MTIWLQIWHIFPWAAVHFLSFIYLFPILRFNQLGYIFLRNWNFFLIWIEKVLPGSLQAMAYGVALFEFNEGLLCSAQLLPWCEITRLLTKWASYHAQVFPV
jgi:hypothetical protein